ncbi:hypothetical protein F4802DRAFT_617515 [Xylaria palmicola]|nr:hypothetical protein F4802DRAFT_617515 [Xylaria palmicola]
MDDPWGWDVERVVQEFCTANRSWQPSSEPPRLPPPDQLQEALRENEVDGEVLLTYDQPEICAELGIKTLKQKCTLKSAIQDLRLRSARYRAYKKRQAAEFEDDSEPEPHSSAQGEAAPTLNRRAVISLPTASAPGSTLLPHSSSTAATDKPPSKKRRLIPTLVTPEIDSTRNRNITTEADIVRRALGLTTEYTGKSVDKNPDELPINAYLGNQPLSRFEIVGVDYANPSDPLSEADKRFSNVTTTQQLPGHMVQISRLMKRRLLQKTIYRRPRFAKSDIVSGSTNPDHDEVLPLYGHSDDDMEYDSDTWREIEEERKERESKSSLPKGLTTNEIDSTFRRVLDEIATKWKETKLPKYASKANQIWTNARRSGLKDAIDRARRELHEFEVRIAKWKETVQKIEYRNTEELENSLSSFEPSIFDREHRSWLISILTSSSEPPKISHTRQTTGKSSKPQPILADDEEVLTSDSEDGLTHFIINDEFDVEMVADDGLLQDTEENRDGNVEYSQADMDIEEDKSYTKINEKAPVEDHPRETASQINATGVSEKEPQMPSKLNQFDVVDLTLPSISSKSSAREVYSRTQESYPLIMDINDLTPTEQMIAHQVARLDQIFVNLIFSVSRRCPPKEIWLDLVLYALNREWPTAPYDNDVKKEGLIAYTLVRLFETYRDDKIYGRSRYRSLDDKGKQRLQEMYELYPDQWDAFIRFLKRLSDRFEWEDTDIRKKKLAVSITPTPDAKSEKQTDMDSISDESEVDTRTSIDDDAKGQTLGRNKKNKKKKRKQVARDREAAKARKMDHAAAAERENRRKLLRERLVTEGSMALGSQHGSIIVNESKGDDQGFIYINDEIALRIKEHQITGVRFMWDLLVTSESRQGCLLAHTMGLGKTMQVLTLLTTIGQASASKNPSIFSQIPEEMRESRTLILCPATLVNNWHDETSSWLPDNHGLGEIFKIDAILGAEQRNQAIRAWDTSGGILIIGYNLFKAFFDDDDMRDVLLERPNIVIADEAHMMKNPKSRTHVAAANFRTLSRVALTGSPLANNVEEYYSMVNWVAPNYLGDIGEFRSRYANPIKDGLLADSSASDRRRALRVLRVLKSEVSPKVSRVTINVLKHDIPVKKEFVITVPLTPIQRQAYEMFIQYHSNGDSGSSKVPNFAIHDLTLICASPSIFLEKLKEIKGRNRPTDKAESVTLPPQLVSDEMALLRNAERAVKDDFTLSWKVPILLEILDQCKKIGDYVLLFSHSRVALDYLEGVLRMKKLSFLRLDGNTHMADRQNMVKRFNNGNVDIFLISTRAGALGLNITGANRVIIFDAQFNPQNEQQAVGRAYRIGQKKPVFVYRFVCGGTCEEKMLNQAIWKMQLASRVVDKKHFLHKAPGFTKTWDMPEEPRQMPLEPFLGNDTVLDALLQNERYKEGIRAVEMMDTFEEEAIEDAELSTEDIALADKMIWENKIRREGQPLGVQLPTHLNGIMPQDGHSVSLAQPLLTGPPNASQPVAHTPPAGYPHASQPLLQHYHTGAPYASQPPQVPPASQPNTAATHVPRYHPVPSTEHSFHEPRPPPALQPVQIAGTEVHTRPSGNNYSVASDVANTKWNSLSAIQADLSHAFTATADPLDPLESRVRHQVGLDISNAIWENIQQQQRTTEERSMIECTIMRAVATGRFIEALCMELISPQQLGQMTPTDIDHALKEWQEIDPSEWETKRTSRRSRKALGDPENLQSALRRLSSAPDHGENNRQLDQSRSYRLDDHEALHAVFERRRLKTQKKDDQEAVNAVWERRKAKGSPPHSSDTGKEPRLPAWAKTLVRQAQIPAPSPQPPKATPSPTFPLQRRPKSSSK